MERNLTDTSLHHRIIEEAKEFLAVAVYLYVCIGALMLLKTAILRDDAGISYDGWGRAAIKALVVAKFMLLGRAAKIGMHYKEKPLIWPTLHMSLMFFTLLLVLTTFEELLVGLFHHRTLAASFRHIVGWPYFVGFANSLIMFLILVPYCAFKCLGEALGEGYLTRAFFVEHP